MCDLNADFVQTLTQQINFYNIGPHNLYNNNAWTINHKLNMYMKLLIWNFILILFFLFFYSYLFVNTKLLYYIFLGQVLLSSFLNTSVFSFLCSNLIFRNFLVKNDYLTSLRSILWSKYILFLISYNNYWEFDLSIVNKLILVFIWLNKLLVFIWFLF